MGSFISLVNSNSCMRTRIWDPSSASADSAYISHHEDRAEDSS